MAGMSAAQLAAEVWLAQLPLAQQLRMRRQIAGLTLADLAKRTDILAPRLSEFEHGHRAPTTEQLETIMAAFDVAGN